MPPLETRESVGAPRLHSEEWSAGIHDDTSCDTRTLKYEHSDQASVLEFSCRAHLDEFVIDAEDPGTFTASDGVLTHTGNRVSPAVSVSVDEVESVSFERNTTLHRNRLLGVFFGILSVLLLALFYALVGLGTVESLNEAAIAGFVLVLGLGGLSTTHEYIRHENRDVIDVYVTTDDEQFVVCGRTDDDEFVDSCIDLADSDLPTTIRSSGLEPVLN